MNSDESAIDVLRGATHAAHASLEQTLTITRSDAGKAEYINYAAALYGWLAPFENRLWSSHWPDGLNIPRRQGKCAWLEEDLKMAGIDIQTIRKCGFTPDLTTMASRIGVAYVIEGAQLGTRILSKSLQPKLEGWKPRWLQGYGNETAENWREFLTFAERNLQGKKDRQTAASAATASFASLSVWFSGIEEAGL